MDKEQIIQLRNHHLKQGRNNDRRPIYPITKAECIIGDVGGGVTKVNTLPETGEAGKIYYNTSDNTYYVYNNDKFEPIAKQGMAGCLTKEDIDVSSNQDGTVDFNVKDDTYKINLNHTHENMAKIVKCTEATLPQTMADDTIYVQVDNLTTPSEIEALHIFGLEFTGGGIPDTGEPMIVSPSDGSTLNLGDNSAGSGVSKTITVKGKNLTGDLTVAVGTGLTISYGQSTGQSSVTIPMAQASLGAQVTIAYSGSGSIDDGSLVISQGNDVLSVVVVVVAELPNGYTRLEYVDNAVRGIDTGIFATSSTSISGTSVVGTTWELDLQANSIPESSQYVLCTNEDAGHYLVQRSTGYFSVGGADYQLSALGTSRNVYTVTYYSNKVTVECGGETKTRNYTVHNKYTVCLFNNMNANSSQYAGGQYTGRIYSIRCTSGGSFNGVPAQRDSDGAKGLYDKANDVFYPLT